MVETTSICEKKIYFAKKKDFGIFSVSSKFEKLKGRFLRVQKVFRQLLWKLKDHFCNT